MSIFLTAAVLGQNTCGLFGSDVWCYFEVDTLPTLAEWGNGNVESATGQVILSDNALTEIPAGGFNACPYTAATTLLLENNAITRVGARAFVTLTALTELDLKNNRISWMAPTSLYGLNLEVLFLNENQLGQSMKQPLYAALAPMAALRHLELQDQGNGTLSCGGKDEWGYHEAAEIAAAVALCGADEPLESSTCPTGCALIIVFTHDKWASACENATAGATACADVESACDAAHGEYQCCVDNYCYVCSENSARPCNKLSTPTTTPRSFPEYLSVAAEAEAAGLTGPEIGWILGATALAVLVLAMCYLQRRRAYVLVPDL